MSLASYEFGEALLTAPTSVFSATHAPFLVLLRSGDARPDTVPRGPFSVRYRRIAVYQEGVTRRAQSTLAKGVSTAL